MTKDAIAGIVAYVLFFTPIVIACGIFGYDIVGALRRSFEDRRTEKQPILPQDYSNSKFRRFRLPLSLTLFGGMLGLSTPLTSISIVLGVVGAIACMVLVYWVIHKISQGYISFEDGCVRCYEWGGELSWSVPQGAIREIRLDRFTINGAGEYTKTIFLITDEGEYDVVARRYRCRRRLRKMLFGLAQKHP